MASAAIAQEALRAWIKLLPPDQQEAILQSMGNSLPGEADAPPVPTSQPSQGDPATTPIPEEPRLTQPQSQEFLAQQEWHPGQDSFFSGPVPPEMPWQDDDLSAHASASSSQQPMQPTVDETLPEPTSTPDREPWLIAQA